MSRFSVVTAPAARLWGADAIDIIHSTGGLMPSGELSVPITEGRFRARRVYLSPEAFADPGDGDHTPTNLIDPQVSMRLSESSAALPVSLLGSASCGTEVMARGTGPKGNELAFGLAMLDWPSTPL